MELKKLMAGIEAVLFANGDAVEVDRLSQLFEADKATVKKILQMLKDRYDQGDSGLCLLRLGESYQLSTREEFAPQIKAALDMKRDAPLSGAAFEVLSIIAYNQPVTRGFVEQVRGVDSSGTMANLMQKGLIEEADRLDLPGRPIAFRTTENFLRCFGLANLDELPPLPRDEEVELAKELAGAGAEAGAMEQEAATETAEPQQ